VDVSECQLLKLDVKPAINKIKDLGRSQRCKMIAEKSPVTQKIISPLSRPLPGPMAERFLVASMILFRPSALNFRFSFFASGSTVLAAVPDFLAVVAHLAGSARTI